MATVLHIPVIILMPCPASKGKNYKTVSFMLVLSRKFSRGSKRRYLPTIWFCSSQTRTKLIRWTSIGFRDPISTEGRLLPELGDTPTKIISVRQPFSWQRLA